MNKSKLIGYIAAGLLLSNLALVAFILFAPHRPPSHEGPRDLIIERLHFDQQQIESYDKLIAAHRTAIRDKESDMLHLKDRLYRTLVSGDQASNDSIEKAIGNIQIDIEKINYNHFHDIEQLCNASQRTDFNNLVNDIAELFARPMRRPPGK